MVDKRINGKLHLEVTVQSDDTVVGCVCDIHRFIGTDEQIAGTVESGQIAQLHCSRGDDLVRRISIGRLCKLAIDVIRVRGVRGDRKHRQRAKCENEHHNEGDKFDYLFHNFHPP